VDTETHYDSLTYPANVSPVEDWSLGTAAATEYSGSEAIFGTANYFPGIAPEYPDESLYGWDDRHLLAALGASALVEFRGEGDVSGTTGVRFAIETPFGSQINLAQAAQHEWYGAGVVTWDDGVDSFAASADKGGAWNVIPAASACFGADEVLLDDFDPNEWRAMGKHSAGSTVYLPVKGGNAAAKATWEWMRDNSWADQIDEGESYPYDTYGAFLTGRSVFTWQRPDGAWVLAISREAGQRVYECA